jgi:hypothetical protein
MTEKRPMCESRRLQAVASTSLHSGRVHVAGCKVYSGTVGTAGAAFLVGSDLGEGNCNCCDEICPRLNL